MDRSKEEIADKIVTMLDAAVNKVVSLPDAMDRVNGLLYARRVMDGMAGEGNDG